MVQPEVGAAAEHLDHVADDRQPGVAHHGLQIAARWGLGQHARGPVGASSRFSSTPMPGTVRIGDV